MFTAINQQPPHSTNTASALLLQRPAAQLSYFGVMERLSEMLSVIFCKHNKNGRLFIRLACSSLVKHGSAMSVIILQMFPWQRYFFVEE